MARRPRLQFPGAIYHVMSRGNRKAPIFDDDHDRDQFLRIVGTAANRYAVRVYAFCLMGNHYHLVLDTPRGNLADAMRYINGVCTQDSNRRHKRTGHVFEGRCRSSLVQRESYLRRVVRYVVLNPVRARVVHDASAWQWSSYRATGGLEPSPPFLYADWIDWAFASVSREEAQRKYRLIVNDAITKRTKLDLYGVALGTPQFEAGVREAAASAHPDMRLPRLYRSLGRPSLHELFGVTRSKGRRNRLMYDAHVEYGYRLAEIAAFLLLDPSTISHIVSKIETATLGA